MSTPSERTQSVESSPLNPSRVPSYLPAILPHPPYVSLLASPQDLFNPLKSLGRLVSNSSNVGPFSYRDLPPMLNPNSLLNDSFIGHLPSPHLLFNRGQHTAPYSKTEANNNSIIRFHPLVPAHHPRGTDSPRSSSSPRRCKALSISTPCIEVKPTRTYHFTEEDLHNVLYGYTQGMDDRRPLHCTAHALSGLRVPPTNTGMDSHTLDRDSLQIPQGLSLIKTVYGDIPKCGVFSTSIIPKGVKFGPFEGKVVNTSEIKTYDDNSLMWEIFEECKLSHFIDGKGASGNWMSLVNCARFPEEQNLIAIQSDQEIFYECCKEILPRQELLVWYGDCYRQFLGIPVSLKGMDEEKPQYQLPEESAEGYKCERCGKVFAYKYYRDKHLKYTRCVDQGDRKFPCHLCNRSFEKRDRLRIHILHVHEKHRPHKCTVCGKSFSQSSSLNKHMRVHSGERPYKCVYCNKAFTASSILRTHIRQHSGEKPFKCKHCGKAFASHAAHDSHVRRTHNKDKGYTCAVCGKMFQEAEELKYHMQIHSGF